MEVIMIRIALAYLSILNVLGFILMGVDKRRAVRKAWRIPESTLFTTAFLGGGIGSFIGMYVFRHKTKHKKFVILFPIAAIIYGFILYQLLIIF
jgi:uncharacterized membrane protein YsdA (DUF1294 family)